MSLLDQASLILTPNAYKANKLYSIVPSSGSGDLTTTRATIASRTNNAGVIETLATGVPRLDYSDSLTSPSILLEPQRTNLLSYSSTFTDASWGKTSMNSVLDSIILSPDGTANSYKTSRASTSTAGYTTKISATSVNTIYTISIFAKLGDVSTNFGLRCQGLYPDRGDALFNLQTGTLIGVANGGTNTNTTATIKPVGNGWYKCSVTTTFLSSPLNTYLIFSPTSLTSITGFEAPDGALSNCYLWGGQLEQGAYATSYIPTTTSTVTRNQDLISKTNLYTNNFITSAGGTWFTELTNNFILTRDTGGQFGIGTTSEISLGSALTIRRDSGTGRLLIVKYISASGTPIYTTLTDTIKVAIKWNGTTADVFVNGVKVVTSTLFTTTAMEFIQGNTSDVPKYIKSFILFPTPLTDAEMASLTTL